VVFPAKLDRIVRVAVTRPRVSRSREEKEEEEEEEEVLVVDGVQVVDHLRYVKFDVFVNQCAAGDGSARHGGSRVRGELRAHHAARDAAAEEGEGGGRLAGQDGGEVWHHRSTCWTRSELSRTRRSWCRSCRGALATWSPWAASVSRTYVK